MNQEKVIPFLKWAGGKRWFVQKYNQFLPQKYNRYIEPFLGGGSVFFYLKPKKAILGDTNPDLIAAYKGIRHNSQALNRLLHIHQKNHCDERYIQKLTGRQKVLKSREQATCNPLSWVLQIICSYALI